MAAKERFLHALFFTVFAATTYHNIANIFIEGVTNSYGGRFKFLTFINLIISVLYYGFATFVDARKALSRNPDVEDQKSWLALRDVLFGSLIFPLSFIVTFAFWGVMAVDSELMLPTRLRHMIPVNGFYNHCAHTAPFLVSLLEMFLVKHQEFPSKKKGGLFFTFFCIGYLAWIMWIAMAADIWVYPVLKVLSWPGRALFLGGVYLFGLTLFLAGHRINAYQGSQISEKVK